MLNNSISNVVKITLHLDLSFSSNFYQEVSSKKQAAKHRPYNCVTETIYRLFRSAADNNLPCHNAETSRVLVTSSMFEHLYEAARTDLPRRTTAITRARLRGIREWCLCAYMSLG